MPELNNDAANAKTATNLTVDNAKLALTNLKEQIKAQVTARRLAAVVVLTTLAIAAAKALKNPSVQAKLEAYKKSALAKYAELKVQADVRYKQVKAAIVASPKTALTAFAAASYFAGNKLTNVVTSSPAVQSAKGQAYKAFESANANKDKALQTLKGKALQTLTDYAPTTTGSKVAVLGAAAAFGGLYMGRDKVSDRMQATKEFLTGIKHNRLDPSKSVSTDAQVKKRLGY